MGNYHKKIAAHSQYVRKGQEKLLEGDTEAMREYTQKAIDIMAEADEELKRVCIEQGAPQEYIDRVNILANFMNKMMQRTLETSLSTQ